MQVSEKLRLQLLKEEFKLRKKQPQAWTVQKYRKYANIGIRKKKEKPEFIEEEKELEARLLKEEEPSRLRKAKKANKKPKKHAIKKAKKARKAHPKAKKQIKKRAAKRTKKKGKRR